ncbi:chitotriosidase-1 [Aspergillus udagawae]|uniref:chitinase n=1 Tax=Aspergillus udagawae TaxID=91492 RepID=A0ABQ1ASE8_9EURO|nr:chitotriosidase-1 [Aspergillus udagawae]GFG26655.1 chitotriosidase-1 [Aspergillus udagawae]
MRISIVFAAFASVVWGLSSQDPASATDYTCSATKPCKIGCCSNTGVCGLGPDFCGKSCISSCDQKSECDPGWGAQWSQKEKCPLNVCCSKFGFCGTTKDFCGNKTVTKPSCSGSSSNKRSIGYYEGWSNTRACYGMMPEQLPVGAYTHLNFAFAFIDPKSFKVAPMSAADTELYSRFTGLKDSNPGLQTWISIGGWSMNDPDQPTATTFSDLAGSSSAQSAFFSSLISFLQTWGFDGVDIDWEYPVATERSGKPQDFQNYVSFLKNLRSALGGSGHNYGLTITVPSSYWYMQHFDIVAIEKVVDWFNVMTYDLHGTWDSTDKFIGPIVNAHTNLTEIDLTMDLFWRNKIDPGKIVMGLGFYGRSFTLSDPSCTKPGCGFSGGGNPGKCSASAGTLMYSEIQDILAAGANATMDKNAAVKQVVWDNNQWVSFDDQETLKMKTDYANGKCLGGTMIWAASTDDTVGSAAQAYIKTNGLVSRSLFGGGANPKEEDVLSACIWGECGKDCPDNSLPAQRSDGKNRGNAGIYTGCSDGQTRNYCCPKGQEMPTCQWRGGAPFCNGKCHSGEVQVSSDTSATGSECWTGHKVLCCTSTKSDAGIGQCKWEGSAPFCGKHGRVGEHYGCDESDRYEETYDSLGAGGEEYCFSGYKSFCCTKPPPFTGCGWTSKEHPWLHPFTCPKGCPAGKQIIAQDPSQTSFCDSGSSFYCCDLPLEDIPDSDSDLNFCQSTDGDYVLSIQDTSNNNYDDDGNPADILELWWYEEDVFVIPNDASPDNMKRGVGILDELQALRIDRQWDRGSSLDNRTLPQICNTPDNCFFALEPDLPEVQALLDEVRLSWEYSGTVSQTSKHPELVERARVRSSVVKLPRNRRTRFIASTYYTVAELAGKGRKFWANGAGKATAICLKNAAAFQARKLARKYVTEHVTELQTPAQFAQSMIDNKYPDKSIPQGVSSGYSWEDVFGDTGYVHWTWKDLGVARPAGLDGDTPIEAIYHALGSKSGNADYQNLMICDAQTNSLKTSAWAIHTNVIGDDRWKKASPSVRLAYLNNIDQSLIPANHSIKILFAQAQDALKHAYEVQQQIFKALDSAAQNNPKVSGPGATSFAALHKTWYQRFFEAFNDNLQTFYQAKVDKEITNWTGGSQAYGLYKSLQRNKIVSDLKGRSSKLSSLTVLTAWIT